VDVLLFYGFFGIETFLHYRDHPAVAPSLNPALMEAALRLGTDLQHTIAASLRNLPVPIICSTFLGLDESLIGHLVESGVPFLPTPERAARAAGALCRYGQWRRTHPE